MEKQALKRTLAWSFQKDDMSLSAAWDVNEVSRKMTCHCHHKEMLMKREMLMKFLKRWHVTPGSGGSSRGTKICKTPIRLTMPRLTLLHSACRCYISKKNKTKKVLMGKNRKSKICLRMLLFTQHNHSNIVGLRWVWSVEIKWDEASVHHHQNAPTCCEGLVTQSRLVVAPPRAPGPMRCHTSCQI